MVAEIAAYRGVTLCPLEPTPPVHGRGFAWAVPSNQSVAMLPRHDNRTGAPYSDGAFRVGVLRSARACMRAEPRGGRS